MKQAFKQVVVSFIFSKNTRMIQGFMGKHSSVRLSRTIALFLSQFCYFKIKAKAEGYSVFLLPEVIIITKLS